tara:strand:- start:356 stop:529 length:174 start_codon:yes stop_codon:yes gene_type:complete
VITVIVTLEMNIAESEISPSYRNEESIKEIVESLVEEIPCGIDGCTINETNIKVDII